MRYRKLDANGDAVFGGDQAAFWRDQPEAVAQAAVTRLGLFTGDWFLDTAAGTAWRTRVLGTHTITTYDATIRARILQTPGVTVMTKYRSQRSGETRNLLVSVVLDTAYGPATIPALPVDVRA